MSNLFVLPRQTPVTPSGSIYSGAKAYFYRTGTATLKDTYSVPTLTAPNANSNPVVADSGGMFGPIYLDTSDYEYRVRIETSAGVLIYQQDNVGGNMSQAEFDALLATTTGGHPRTAAEIAASVTPTDYTKEPGDFLRYGLSTGASAATNSTAINNAMLSNSYVFCDVAGTYVCSATLSPQSNQTIRLSQGVVLQPSVKVWAGPFVSISGKSNINWYGGVLDGNKSGNPTGIINGMSILDSSNIKIIGVTSKNFPSDNTTLGAQGDGFYAGGFANPGASDIDFIGCTSDGNVRQGLSIVRGRRIRVIGGSYINTTGNNPGGGIDIEADTSLYTLDQISLIGVTVSGCYFGIIFQQYCTNSTMSGCTVRDCRFAHLYATLCNRISITGNTFDAQVAFDSSSPIVDFIGGDNIVFTGNYLRGAHLTNQGVGLRVLMTCDNVLVANNTFELTNTGGVGIGSSAMTTANTVTRITGNTFIDCVDPAFTNTGVIGVSGNSGSSIYPLFVQINDNYIYDTRSGGNEADRGIDVSTNIPLATQANYRIQRNYVSGPASNYTPGVFPPMTGGVAWNPADLVDGAGETSPDITVTGATIGDHVDVYPPYAITDCICSGYVKSSNTVAIRLQNESGSANFNGASATWIVRVTKLTEA